MNISLILSFLRIWLTDSVLDICTCHLRGMQVRAQDRLNPLAPALSGSPDLSPELIAQIAFPPSCGHAASSKAHTATRLMLIEDILVTNGYSQRKYASNPQGSTSKLLIATIELQS